MNSLSYIPARKSPGKSSDGFLHTTAKPGGDVYPFGMQMPGRIYNSDDYNYGFNGMEKDDEIKGSGNSLDFGARIFDSRLGRWLSLDPLAKKYPYASPYGFVDNSPVLFVDPDGKEIWIKDPNRKKPVLYVPNETWVSGEVSDFVRETAATLDGISASGMDDKFKIVETLANDDYEVTISEIPWDTRQSNAGDGAIEWGPQGGIVTDEGERQTPAEGLLHELAHKYYEVYDPTGEVAGRPDMNKYPDDRIKYDDKQVEKAGEYDTPSDKWIINEVEGGAGGTKRKAHSFKDFYRAIMPFSTEGPAKSEMEAE